MANKTEFVPTELTLTSRFAEVLGSRMHYFELGEDQPVLFFHGNPVWSYIWRNIMPMVENSGRCIAFDLIGMGRSDKPGIEYTFHDHARYVEGFIETLGLKDLILVLHDWGIALGLEYALRHPANVKAIAIIANGTRGLVEGVLAPLTKWNELDPQSAEMLRSFRDPARGWKLLAEENIFIDELLPQGAVRGIGPEQIAFYNAPYKSPEERRAIWAWPQQIPVEGKPPHMENVISEVNRFIRETRMPKLFIHGEPDGIGRGIPMVKWFMENVKNIEFRSVGHVGHYLQEDCPETIGSELNQWIKKLNR